LLTRLLLGTLVPTVAALAVFGVLAHEVARRSLEDELGRRLATAAAGAALTVLPDQIRALRAGDEDSLTYANVRRKLATARQHLDVRRVLLVAGDLSGRGDSDERVALGAPAYEISADRLELDKARAGTPCASLLFVGHDGLPYKRGYAVIGTPGDGAAGFAVVEGSADYFRVLAAFRRWLFAGGVVALLVVLGITVVLARRITGPVARLVGVWSDRSAHRLGHVTGVGDFSAGASALDPQIRPSADRTPEGRGFEFTDSDVSENPGSDRPYQPRPGSHCPRQCFSEAAPCHSLSAARRRRSDQPGLWPAFLYCGSGGGPGVSG